MEMKDYAIVRILHHVFNAVGIYLLWIILHYACSHLYVYYCTPMSFVGFITSPVVVPSHIVMHLGGLYTMVETV